MKVGDLVYYLSPIESTDQSCLAFVIEVDHERDVAYIKWTDNGQIDMMPIKWLGIIQPSKSAT